MVGMNRFIPNDGKKKHPVRSFIFSLITVFVLLIALPIGVYLVGQNTNFIPQAATPAPKPVQDQGDTSFSFDLKQDQITNTRVGVNVLIHSDVHEASLFATKISFPKELLSVESIATSSAQKDADSAQIAAKWVDTSIDNDSGTITLIAGVPRPGLKTQADKKYVLATIYFTPKINAQAKLAFDPNSKIYQTSPSTILPTKKTDVLLKVPNPGVEPSPACVPYPPCFDQTPSCDLPEPSGGWCRTPQSVGTKQSSAPSLQLIAPNGGDALNLTSQQMIKWQSSNLSEVDVQILMNDQLLGRIASAPASLGQIPWNPQEVIYPAFANTNNTFKIALVGRSDKGVTVSDESKGPFSILPGIANFQFNPSTKINQDLTGDGKTDLDDLALLFSSFGPNPPTKKADLNGDGVVNDIDLWLFTQGITSLF